MFLDQLTEDHKNFTRVLGLLQRQLDELTSFNSPDYYLMLKIVQYFEEYPGRCHHPVEDALLSIYLKRSTDGADIIENLLKDHSGLEKITLDLRSQIEAILAGKKIDIEVFKHQLAGFLQRQQDHMAVEELKVFPLLRKVLNDGDWDTVKRRLALQKDPLFGSQVPHEYESLYRHISCQVLDHHAGRSISARK